MYFKEVCTQDEYLKKYMKIYIPGIWKYLKDEIKINLVIKKKVCVYT